AAKENKSSASTSINKSTAKDDKSNTKGDKGSTSASTGKSSAKDDKTAKDTKATSNSDKPTSTGASTAKSSKPAVVDSKTALINLNKASETELETVAGIGPTYARKIIEKRPYKSIDDLSKAGIPASTIAKIRPLVTTSDSVASQVTINPATPDKMPALVDVNKATAEQLKEVPGIGEAYSKKIVDNRPYKSVDDLSKAGIPAVLIEKVKPLITVDGTPAVAPPSKGMVWVNLETKLYHRESSRWYGKTKSGKYMTEAEAEKAGYKASKQ
ncbi:MAG TPA: helix-hairpin-helix domain-containing protein, partial [Lacipirellulaceae bacterium]|nr:helix-hairpin-helix domain-containing protein [Lacipirellulaceae bacterium]